jgi:hypothetical protein
MTNTQDQISALLIERAGYVARNLPKRVASCDAALEALGYKASTREAAAIEPTMGT